MNIPEIEKTILKSPIMTVSGLAKVKAIDRRELKKIRYNN